MFDSSYEEIINYFKEIPIQYKNPDEIVKEKPSFVLKGFSKKLLGILKRENCYGDFCDFEAKDYKK